MTARSRLSRRMSSAVQSNGDGRMRFARLVAALICAGIIAGCGINAQLPPPGQEAFADCTGVFEFRNKPGYGKDASVNVYDEDGSIWYRAEFNKDGFDALRDAGPNPITPLVHFQGEYTPVFRCVSRSANWYAVVVVEDDSNPIVKYMRRDDGTFEYKSWNQYFEKKWIRFDAKVNPLRPTVDSNVILEFPGEDIRMTMTTLDGDWMKLEWTNDSGEARTGWIRWRDGRSNRIIVSFPYA
jgi:hypothetical protein